MKAIIEFNLPEEKAEHELALAGGAWKSVVWDFYYEHLRKPLKYGNLSDEESKTIRGLQSALIQLLEDEGLRLE